MSATTVSFGLGLSLKHIAGFIHTTAIKISQKICSISPKGWGFFAGLQSIFGAGQAALTYRREWLFKSEECCPDVV
jgi:hypothetical protein